MQAIIMAAGKGTRLRPLTLKTPKPLVRVGGLSLLQRNLAALPEQVTEVILVVNYLQDQIRQAIGESWSGRPIKYVEQSELNGSDGAIRACRAVLKAGSFLVLNGDDLYQASDLAQLAGKKLAMLTLKVDDPTSAATCKVNRAGCLVDVFEAGSVRREPPYLINCGAYVLSSDYFKAEPVRIHNGEFGLPQTLADMAKKGAAVWLTRASEWLPVGSPEQLAVARKKFEH